MPSPASADASPPMLLIHGAWQGSWAWDALLPELAARGVRAHAADLPGNGSDGTPPHAVSLDGAVEHLAEWVDAQPGPVVVVGHSGGGIAASQLAESRPDRIACLFYVAGMMLPSGVSYAALVRELAPRYPEVSGIGPHLRWTPNGLASTVPPDAAMRIFFHDCPAEAAALAASKLTAQAEGGRAVAPRLTAARYGRVPRVYIEALRDRSVVLPMQRHMQTLSPGAVRYAIDCGHVPQLAQPAALADLMLSALARQAAATA
ncbi:pimeloyl-ACP methyl ester carboxylesterase [Cupriavidus gilardii J11]|uniref:Pimeloyl-ACP methyl ester carboxylesterase n=1 Tax=Cupriavidus gilardii J11 TaxID=936133 RepID=A0A562BNA5_9BURK|nr:alpha/beta fold hydrolase [Cupriavidus gilardii]TWG86400.1 pimeloyl-ACP methyl ester carboxylesterase [Cupriavidus gilardii J11]